MPKNDNDNTGPKVRRDGSNPIRHERVRHGAKFSSQESVKRSLNAGRSVARVGETAYDGEATAFRFSGEWVRPDWKGRHLLLTNAHAVAPSTAAKRKDTALVPEKVHITFFGEDNEPVDKGQGKVGCLWSSPHNELDATLLEANFSLEQFPKLELGTPELLQSATRVHIIGHPAGRTKKYSLESCERVKKTDTTGSFLHYNSPTEEGSSGSPLFDSQWRLLGMHQGSDDYADANRGISIFAIIDALKQAFPGPVREPAPPYIRIGLGIVGLIGIATIAGVTVDRLSTPDQANLLLAALSTPPEPTRPPPTRCEEAAGFLQTPGPFVEWSQKPQSSRGVFSIDTLRRTERVNLLAHVGPGSKCPSVQWRELGLTVSVGLPTGHGVESIGVDGENQNCRVSQAAETKCDVVLLGDTLRGSGGPKPATVDFSTTSTLGCSMTTSVSAETLLRKAELSLDLPSSRTTRFKSTGCKGAELRLDNCATASNVPMCVQQSSCFADKAEVKDDSVHFRTLSNLPDDWTISVNFVPSENFKPAAWKGKPGSEVAVSAPCPPESSGTGGATAPTVPSCKKYIVDNMRTNTPAGTTPQGHVAKRGSKGEYSVSNNGQTANYTISLIDVRDVPCDVP